jgi:predicted TPR repeat methyltransferase
MDEQTRAMVEAYDEEAKATGWLGPEVALRLTHEYVRPGQSILDIGIGTALGSIPFRNAGLEVYGMDVSQEMLDACRSKGFTHLACHDLTKRPYPYPSESLDHIVCVGVLQFYSDLSPVFVESARILRRGGLFVFVVVDRTEDETPDVVVGAEHTKLGVPVTMYRHSVGQINTWATEYGFTPLRNLAFTVYMDREKTRSLQARAHLVRRRQGGVEAM